VCDVTHRNPVRKYRRKLKSQMEEVIDLHNIILYYAGDIDYCDFIVIIVLVASVYLLIFI
jgi:hypothetical protein